MVKTAKEALYPLSDWLPVDSTATHPFFGIVRTAPATAFTRRYTRWQLLRNRIEWVQ